MIIFIREMRKIFIHTKSGLKFLFLLLLRSPVNTFITLTQAIFLQNAFNSILDGNKNSLNMVCLYFGIASFLLFLYNGTVWSFYAPFAVKLEGIIRKKLFGKISSLSLSKIETKQCGEWITRLNTDVQMPFNQPIHIPHAICSAVGITVSAIILVSVNYTVFLLTLVFVVPQILINQFLIAAPMTGLSKKSLEATDKNASDLNSFIICADTMILYDAKEFLLKKFESSSKAMLKANMKMRNLSAINGALFTILGSGGYLLILILSGAWIKQGSLTFGDLTAAFQYRVGVLMGSIMLINSIVNIKASMAGIKRINETLEIKTEG